MSFSYPISETIEVPAGAWVRSRWLPAPDRRNHCADGPAWRGLWHVATGDVRVWLHNNRRAVARCGRRVQASLDYRHDGVPVSDAVVALERPGADECGRCLRLLGLAPLESAPERIPLSPEERKAWRVISYLRERRLLGLGPSL